VDPIPVAVIVVYLVATTVIGSLLARRSATPRGWTVAGGELGLAMLAAGLAGTRIGGAGTYGVAGNVLAGGVWYLWWYAASTFLALALVGLVFAAPFRRLGLETVGEAFWLRHRSRRNQILTSLCVQTEYFVVNVIEAYVIAAILRGLVGLPLLPGVLVAWLVIASYTALGGLWGAAVTNLIHSGTIVVGLAAVATFGVAELGGWSAVTRQVDAQLASAGRDGAAWWSPIGAGLLPILGMVVSAAVHTPAASIYANFSTAARRERLLVPAFLLAGIVAGLMPLLAGVVGLLTLARFGQDGGLAGYASITAFAIGLDPWVGGVAVAAVLAAVVSSGGPVLLSSATMFVRDWIPASRTWPPERRLRAYRTTTAVYGLAAALAAWLVARTGVSLLDLLLLAYAMVVPPAVALGYLLFWRRTSEAGAFWGMATGYLSGVAWYAWAWWTGRGLDPSVATAVVPLAFVPLVSWLAPNRTDVGEAAAADGFYARLARPADDAAGAAAAPAALRDAE
jgi:SSS family solute:Na+ symporter